MTFDPELFMQQEESGELDTTFTPVPEGDYQAVATETKIRTTESGHVILDVVWEISDPEVAAETGRDTNTVRQSIFLDMNADNTRIDVSKGKNINLGRLFEAIGVDMSKGWSLAMIQGNPALVHVAHRADKNDPSVLYADVTRVAALG